jgi:AcrR family transcriptional regulator
VIDAALAIIAEHGIPALGDHSRLAAAAGLDPGELTELFPDRRDLLAAALRNRVDSQIERFATLAAGMRRNPPSPEDAAAAAQGITWGAAESAAEIAELEIHLQAARDPDPALQAETRRAFAAYEDFAAGVLESLGLPSGPEAARLAITLFTGLALHRLSTGERHARGTYEGLITLARGLNAEPPS